MVYSAQFEPDYDKVVEAHGILGCVAWVIFFPLGAILLRVIPSPKSWMVHAVVMLFALSLFTVNAGMGVWQAEELNQYHQIIGILLFSLAWVQPITGIIHHTLYQKLDRRTIASFLHISTGRALLTLGMINGGLGILYAGDASRQERIAYGTIAGIVWITYFTVAFVYEDKRETTRAKKMTMA